jgi:hypothetical protein
MPAAFAAIGDLLFAILCIAIAMSILTFGKFIAQLIPNLPLIGSALRDGVTDAIEDAGGWLVGQASSSWDRLANFITDIGYMDKWVAIHTIGALANLFNQTGYLNLYIGNSVTSLQNNINHTNDTVVPAAISTAENEAHSELATTATNLQNNINSVVDNTIPTEVGAAAATAHSELVTATDNLQNNINSLSSDVTTELANVWDNLNPLNTAVYTSLPNLIAANAAAAAAQEAADARTAQGNLVAATDDLQGNLDLVQAQLQSSIASQGAAETALAAADLQTAEGQATAVAAAATIAAEAQAQTSLKATAATLQGNIDLNTQQIDTLETTTAINLPALPNVSIPSTISVPVAVGALALSVSGIISEIDSCMVSVCDGPNNITSLLNGILGGLTTLGEIGFIAAAIKDPVGTAGTFDPLLSGLYGIGHDAFDELLSL